MCVPGIWVIQMLVNCPCTVRKTVQGRCRVAKPYIPRHPGELFCQHVIESYMLNMSMMLVFMRDAFVQLKDIVFLELSHPSNRGIRNACKVDTAAQTLTATQT